MEVQCVERNARGLVRVQVSGNGAVEASAALVRARSEVSKLAGPASVEFLYAVASSGQGGWSRDYLFATTATGPASVPAA